MCVGDTAFGIVRSDHLYAAQTRISNAPLRLVSDTKVMSEYMGSFASSSSLRLRAICTRIRKGTLLTEQKRKKSR